MQYMKNVLEQAQVPADAGDAIEYVIPQTAKRVDFILTGRNPDERDTAIIVELKQWESVVATSKDAIVETFLGGALREVAHPSYQAWTYAALLEDFNETVQRDAISLQPCAYLHNCKSREVTSAFYGFHLERAPAFLKRQALAWPVSLAMVKAGKYIAPLLAGAAPASRGWLPRPCGWLRNIMFNIFGRSV